MDAKRTTSPYDCRRNVTSFLSALRTDRRFCADAKRNGLIGLIALVLAAAMFCLARSRLVQDSNTLEVVVFTCLTATMVLIAAVIVTVIRVVDEAFLYVIARMK